MGPGYNALPPMWVWDFLHWLIIVACFAPLVVALLIILAQFTRLCAQRGPVCPSCGQPWRDLEAVAAERARCLKIAEDVQKSMDEECDFGAGMVAAHIRDADH